MLCMMNFKKYKFKIFFRNFLLKTIFQVKLYKNKSYLFFSYDTKSINI